MQETAVATTPDQKSQQQARSTRTVRLEATHGFSRVLSPRELWQYRDLAVQIAVRDITLRYRQTALGAAWAILQPLAFMAVFSIIFGRFAHLESDGLPYALFALAGLVPWAFYASTLQLGSESLLMYTELVSKIYFPRIFMPFGILVAGMVDLLVSSVLLVVIVMVYGIVPPPAVLMVPVLVLIAAAAALGITSALSAINVKFRDVRYVVPFAVQLWFFLTPIVYPNSILNEPLRTISAINPMVGVVEGFRWSILGSGPAPLDLIGISALSAIVLLFAGLAYFDRVERTFADII